MAASIKHLPSNVESMAGYDELLKLGEELR